MLRSKLFTSRLAKQFCFNLLTNQKNEITLKTTCRHFKMKHALITAHQRFLTSLSEKNLQNSNDLNEKDFLVRLKSDPDTFGDYPKEEICDEGDFEEEKYLTEKPHPTQKLSTKQYADIIKSLIAQRKIKEAVDVLEIRMLKEDRVKPESYIYNLILGGLGRVGYTKKAFMLYNDMRKRGLKATGGTYTALFNACSNSPWPTTDGLTRAKKLREIMIEKHYEPNDTNYNVMIKAFGRCGDISTAFLLVDEMLHKKFVIKDDTINFLLQACISDKNAGFRHALLVWRKAIDKNIKPSVFTYNLLLRCVRDCGIGDIETTLDVINKILSDNNKCIENPVKPQLIATSPDNKLLLTNNCIDENKDSLESTLDTLRPNLLANKPHLGKVISLSEITKPEDKLLLLGGCRSFLENMDHHKCSPDIKTFTQLLNCIPNTEAAEKELLTSFKKYDIKPDVDFFNILIKKRSLRYEYDKAKEVLELLKERGYKPNLFTYGVLAMGCKTKEECEEFLTEMDERKYNINIEILGAMLHQACFHQNFNYVMHVMDLCLSRNINPNKKFMETLEGFKKWSKKLSNEQKFSVNDEKNYRKFKTKLKSWNEQVHVDDSDDAHPWQQFREVNANNVKAQVKDAARFKQRHTSLFKVKTSAKHKVYVK